MLSKLFRLSVLVLLLTGCESQMPTILQDNTLLPLTNMPSHAPTPPHQIALLLPLQGDLANAGIAIQAGFNVAYQASANRPIIKTYDTNQGKSVISLYADAINEGANVVIGPLDKTNVTAIMQENQNNVITITLNTIDTTTIPANSYQFALSPVAEARLIADKAAEDGHHAALVITPAGKWGLGIENALNKQWQANGGTVVASMTVDTHTQLAPQVHQLLQVSGHTRRQDFDVIFMIAQPVLARQIKPLLKFYYAGDIPVYSTSLIYSGLINAALDQDLDGVEFCDMPLVLDSEGQWATLRQQFILSQPTDMQQYIRLYGLGWDAAMLTKQWGQLFSSGIHGATGKLTVDAQHHIQRQLEWAVFQDGVPVLLS